MSKTSPHQKRSRTELQPPLISAEDVNPANYPRAHFDDSIAWTIKETARRRAPTRASVWRHQVGFAGELAAAAYCGVKADWEITDDFVGDEGYDFDYNGSLVEVKTVASEDDWELQVPEDKIGSADYYILAHCSRPEKLVYLIGWATSQRLRASGRVFDGSVRVGTDQLLPLEPLELFPDRIRGSQNL